MRGSLFLYNVVLLLLGVLGLPVWGAMAVWRPKYRAGFTSKLTGKTPMAGKREAAPVWFHAVSVGEVLASLPLVESMASLWAPRAVWISTVTATGRAIAESRASGVKGTFYLPYDLPWSVERAVGRMKPCVFVTAETELWPNLIMAMRRHGVKAAMVNGRISDRSFPRYLKLRSLFKPVLHSLDVLCMQSQESAERVLAMGAPRERVHVVGNLKFDLTPPPVDVAEWRKLLRLPQGAMVVVAGSTHPEEEEWILKAFQRLEEQHPSLHLILAPRAPERFHEVENLAVRMGLPLRRRTGAGPPEAKVILLDTLGELAQVYGLANVAFIGGSLVPRGGHNPLEAAAQARPVLFGPHMENFREIASVLLEGKGARSVENPEHLGKILGEMLARPELAEEMGGRARAVMLAHRGATHKTLQLLTPLVEGDRWG